MMAQVKLLSPETTLMVAQTALEPRIYSLWKKWDLFWRQDVAAWINSAWIQLSEDTVRSTFCGSGYYGRAFSHNGNELALEFDPLGLLEPT
jgi:hypothetical protein